MKKCNLTDMLNFIVVVIMVVLVSACGMTDEKAEVLKEAYKECAGSVKYLDIYEKDGTHFSQTSDGNNFVSRICLARAQLYADGYRIGRISKESDLKIYQLSLVSGRSVRGMYKELIDSGIEP